MIPNGGVLEIWEHTGQKQVGPSVKSSPIVLLDSPSSRNLQIAWLKEHTSSS